MTFSKAQKIQKTYKSKVDLIIKKLEDELMGTDPTEEQVEKLINKMILMNTEDMQKPLKVETTTLGSETGAMTNDMATRTVTAATAHRPEAMSKSSVTRSDVIRESEEFNYEINQPK